MKLNLRSWKTAAVLLVVTSAAVAVFATGAFASSHAKVVKVAIMTDCKGAFAFGYDVDIGGAQTAFAQFAHGVTKSHAKPSAGMTGIHVGTTPIKIVGYGCGNDTVPLAVTETKRLMEKLNADVMIGPLSGDEAVYVANYAKAHPTKVFINGTAGSQDPTMQIAPEEPYSATTATARSGTPGSASSPTRSSAGGRPRSSWTTTASAGRPRPA